MRATSADQKIRAIDRSPVVPIAERLLPGDEVVVVTDFPEISGLVDEPVSIPAEVAWHVALSDAAVVVEVSGVKSRLTPEGLWIESTITARVLSVAMERRPGTRQIIQQSELEGKAIELRWIHGGEVSIGSVRVRAHPSQLEAGRRYLVFMTRGSDGEWYLSSRFEIVTGDTLRHLFEPDKNRRYNRSPLDGLPLERVMLDLKRQAARRDR
jgi:hypothetical protein